MNNIQTLKGFRDFLPQEARKRQYVIDILKKTFGSYGFEPLETPTLEYEEILAGKYGEEGDKLIYKFVDNGDRRVAMRYDQTVPLARVVAQYPSAGSGQVQNDLPMPFKRYQIGNVWRAENTQKGRYREFMQVDIDTVGTTSPLADAEIVGVVNKVYENLGFKNFKILLNDRSVFGKLPTKAITVIDKLKKIGPEKVKEELRNLNVPENTLENITNTKLPENLIEIIKQAEALGVKNEKMVFTPTLARGLDYYTGMIVEVECDDYPTGSLAGGGRYDNLIGMFANRQIPAVGLAFGFDRTIEAMEQLGLFPKELSTTKVLVTIFDKELKEKSIKLSSRLRTSNINTELYLDENAKIDKQLKYANTKQIPYVAIIGPDEAKNNKVTIKDMRSGEQKTVTEEELPKLIKS